MNIHKNYFQTDFKLDTALMEDRLDLLVKRSLDQLEVFTFFDWPEFNNKFLESFFNKWIINEPIYKWNRADALKMIQNDKRFSVIIYRLTKIYSSDVNKYFQAESPPLLQ